MISNDITVPDAGSSKQYIADPVGGWMFIVTTSISVEQQNLAQFNSKLDAAKANLAAAQALVDELEPQATAFQTAVEAIPAPVEIAPVEIAPLDTATSTAAM